jgi:hypothetical protein
MGMILSRAQFQSSYILLCGRAYPYASAEDHLPSEYHIGEVEGRIVYRIESDVESWTS